MNRYRTVPGLGPSSSKATSTTTCQKCLKKGHYSYECKASVQSRPYNSRPSRSQQLLNPKLKPALAEQKMEDPKIRSENTDHAPEVQEAKLDMQPEAAKDTDHILANRKRPRSTSLSSDSSVATISTNESETVARKSRPVASRSSQHGTTSRSSSSSRSNPTMRHLEKHNGRHHRESRQKDTPRRRTHDRLDDGHHDSDSDDIEASTDRHIREYRGQQDRSPYNDHEHGSRNKRRRSRSAEVLPDSRRHFPDSSKLTRQRSLSPYSRRLALTQAMNSAS